MTYQFLKAYIFNRRQGALVRTIGWISLCGITLSVLALVVVISIMQGFGAGIRDRLLAVESHLIVEAKEGASRSELIERLNKKEGVDAHLFASQDLMIRTVEGIYGGASGRGIQSASLAEILKSLEIKKSKVGFANQLSLEANPIELQTHTLAKGEVVIGVDLARSLAIFPGDEIVVISPEALLLPQGEVPRYERVRVKSLLRSDVPQIDSQVLFYGLGDTFRGISYATQPYMAIEIRLKEPLQYQKLEQELLSEGHKVSTWVDRNAALFYSLKVEKFLMSLFLSLTFVIGSFSIVTLLVLLKTQKKQDMGMLQAMGLSRKRVRALFAKMGIALTATGIVLGVSMGVVLCLWIDKYSIIRLPDFYYDTKLPVSFDWMTIGLVIGLVFVISTLVSILTAKQVSDESIISTLKRT